MTNEANAQTETQEPAAEPQVETSPFEAELAKARDELLRALAEVENTRRRADRQTADARAYAIDRFANDLLPVADTLTRALGAAPKDGADEAVRNLIDGLELTERSMLDAFARHGLRRVGTKGEAFDPKIHQAVGHAPSDQPANTVVDVLAPGYVLGERTLRAAMVSVSAGGGEGAGVDIKV
jgi:molecular chaperone GrpE